MPEHKLDLNAQMKQMNECPRFHVLMVQMGCFFFCERKTLCKLPLLVSWLMEENRMPLGGNACVTLRPCERWPLCTADDDNNKLAYQLLKKNPHNALRALRIAFLSFGSGVKVNRNRRATGYQQNYYLVIYLLIYLLLNLVSQQQIAQLQAEHFFYILHSLWFKSVTN